MTQSTAFKTEWDKLFIGGKWVEPSTSEMIEVHSPATGELVGKVPMAAKADVDAACAAARKAFDEGPWPHMSPEERAAVLGAAVKIMEERADELKFLLAAFPRYHPRWAWWMTSTPLLREFLVSNLVLVLRAPGSVD